VPPASLPGNDGGEAVYWTCRAGNRPPGSGEAAPCPMISEIILDFAVFFIDGPTVDAYHPPPPCRYPHQAGAGGGTTEKNEKNFIF